MSQHVKKVKIGHIGLGHMHSAGKMACVRRYPEIFDVVGAAFPGEEEVHSWTSYAEFAEIPRMTPEPEKIADVIYGLSAVYDDTYPEYVAEPDVKTFFSSYVFSEYDFESFELQKSILQSEGAVMDPYAYLTSDLDSLVLAGKDSLIYSIMEMNVPVQTAVDTVRDAVSDKIRTMVETYSRIK